MLRRKPREIAERLAERLSEGSRIGRVEVAGPGFVNFRLSAAALQDVVQEIRVAGETYGRSHLGGGRRVQVEFVSSNPTGPLHVGHGRPMPSFGAVLANLLGAVGFDVQREYYVNDIGRQMDTLVLSVWLRYLERRGATVDFPARGYQGDYLRDIAAALEAGHGVAFAGSGPKTPIASASVSPGRRRGGRRAPPRCPDCMDEGSAGHETLPRALRVRARRDGRGDEQDLEEFGIVFDRWYSEGRDEGRGCVERAVDELKRAGHVYEEGGAQWFRATDFGDEKDRVVVRENGDSTYFASDIAYHREKFERGFEHVIDVWGADHHGYVPRLKGALAALGRDPERFEITVLQFVNLYRGGKRVQMSTRAGEFITLRELREETGRDAARFFYVMRKGDQHLDFDLDLAKSRTSENPVYYIQYAHARICSVLRQAQTRGLEMHGEAPERLDVLNEAKSSR